jgi:hypothetical protein
MLWEMIGTDRLIFADHTPLTLVVLGLQSLLIAACILYFLVKDGNVE